MRAALFDSAWGVAALGLTVGSLVLLAALTALARPRNAWMRGRIAVYTGDEVEDGVRGVRPRVDQLFTLTEQQLDRTGPWRYLALLLERSAVGLKPVEVLYMAVATGLGLATLSVALGLPGALVLVALLVGFAVLPLFLTRKAALRLRRFDEQLPDTLLSIASSLKVGHSFDNAVQAVIDKGLAPTSDEFARLQSDTRLGQTMEDALDVMAKRVRSRELAFVLMSVRIQRQVGGTLANLFESVAQVVQERRHFHAKVRALTATGRLTGQVLTGLPIVTALAISALSPGYLDPMLHTTGGLIVSALGASGVVVGGLMLKRIVTVKG
ncbi:MAG: type II secretion system F family protein [Gaiella sp.]